MNVYKKVKKAVKDGGVSLVFKRAIAKTTDYFTGIHFAQNIKHSYEELPKVAVENRPLTSQADDVHIAERILRAFKKAQEDEREHKNRKGDLWDLMQREGYSDFYAVYSDPVKLAEYMNNMNQHSITSGVGSSCLEEYRAMHEKPPVRQEWGVFVKDVLVAFGEAVGVLPYNLNGDNLYVDEGSLLSRIEEKIGITLRPSHIEGGLYKLKINNKFFDWKDFWSAYTAWRIYSLVGPDASIAEIGGGIGKAALYAGQFGIKNYSIYDLPIISLAQAWYLIKSEVDVVLYGEKGQGIQLLPYWEFSKGSFELTINADSFPEMDGSKVADYLETIKKNTRKYLLSLNREDGGVYGDNHKHIVVHDIVGQVGGLERVHRFPSWIGRNYVEELYTVN